MRTDIVPAFRNIRCPYCQVGIIETTSKYRLEQLKTELLCVVIRKIQLRLRYRDILRLEFDHQKI